MRFLMAAFGVVASLLAGTAHAAIANHIYDYTWNGVSAAVPTQSAAGAQLLDGEVVQLTLRALGNDHFTSDGTSVWLPLGMAESAVRVGDLNAVFRLDGVVVGATSYSGEGHAMVHIANFMTPAATMFDEVEWNYLSISSTSANNTLQDLYSMDNPFLGIGNVQYVSVPDAAASAPGTAVIAALGLLALGLRRRSRR